jgi:SAM-dependent methyltransferase
MILHHHHLLASWGRLDEAVRSGGPVRSRVSFSDPETREAFLMGMFNNAMLTAPKLVESLDLAGRHRLLDLGGGPGTYAIHFCRRNPELTASVFDLPATREFAERVIARFAMQARVDFIAGDFVAEAIPGGYDVVWMSHILHGEGPETCREMIRKVHQALEPEGRIIIHEFILDDDDDGAGPVFPALFSLNMLLGTPEGRAYREKELRQMLSSEGFHRIERPDFLGPTGSGLLMAAK